jgi:hypothetical protein
MFELEKSVSAWRHQLKAGGVTSATSLDELENHLREEIARQGLTGVSVEHAFEAAVRELGNVNALKTEFAKTNNGRREKMRRAAVVALLGVILLFGSRAIWSLGKDWASGLVGMAAVIFVATAFFGCKYVMSCIPKSAWPVCKFYMKASGLLFPAAFIWFLFVVAILPKLSEVCQAAHMKLLEFGPAPFFWRGVIDTGKVMILLANHAGVICSALVLAFVLLEWRSHTWRRYRRATVGAGIFVFNFAVLLSLTIMMINALLASSFLMAHVK